MKTGKKILVVVLAVAMAVSMFGCKKSKSGSDDTATYTYNTYVGTSAIHTLNPHEWELNDEINVMNLTQRGFYDIIYSDTEDYEYICEMAAELPKDVTADYAGNETYGVPADAEAGYAYEIKLREDAKWDDGTAINADSYIYSMQQILDPNMSNYRATSYSEGTYALANAYGYYCGGKDQYVDFYNADDGTYAEVDGDNMYTSTTQVTAFFGDSLDNASASYEGAFIAADGTDTLAELKKLQGDNDWVQVTGDVKTALEALVEAVNTNLGMDAYDEQILEYCTYTVAMEKVDWDSVGLVKNDDYSLTIILSKPVTSEYMVVYGYTSNWLVKEDLYEANKKDAGGITKTTYGTSVDTYASYGPYKLVEWQADKTLHLTKNENWYGYSNDEFKGQYQTTDIVYSFIDEHATALQLFLQGKIDDIALDATDLEKYATSDYAVFTPTSYTWKLSFNTDKAALEARQTAGVNKTIITYADFRKAVSLAIDRSEFCQKVRPACSPAYGLLNSLYVYDTSDFSIYRDTDYAKNVLCDVYDTDNYEDIKGFNLEEASKLFQSAYDAAVKAGDLKADDKITLEFNVTTASDSVQNSINFFNDAITAATKGTSLEGKVTIEIKEVDDYYASQSAGTADMIFSAWGGSENDPYSITQCYCDETLYNDGEHGFDSSKTFTATIDGKDETMSFYDWYVALCEGKWAQADPDIRLEVLAAIEGAVLKEYNALPLWNDRSAALLSQKVDYVTYDFSSAYMETYGGFRFMTYNYNDAQWEDYCSENNNQLTY